MRPRSLGPGCPGRQGEVDAGGEQRQAFRQRARRRRGGRTAARGRARRLPDRDRLRPRRRRPPRSRGGRDLRRQGPAGVQPADRARAGSPRRPSGSPASRPPRARLADRLLARAADAGAAAAAGRRHLRRSPPPGSATVALRAPSHPLARRLLEAFGGPLAAPSANPSGRVSATTAAHVLDGLGGRIAAVLDGGACPVGVESTIVGFEGRPRCCSDPAASGSRRSRPCSGDRSPPPPGRGVSAPGQLASHYAPAAALRLEAAAAGPDEVWLGFGGARSGGTPGPRPLAGRRSRRGGGEPLRAPAGDRRAGGARGRGADRGRADPARRPRPRDQRPARAGRGAARLTAAVVLPGASA